MVVAVTVPELAYDFHAGDGIACHALKIWQHSRLDHAVPIVCCDPHGEMTKTEMRAMSLPSEMTTIVMSARNLPIPKTCSSRNVHSRFHCVGFL